MNTKRFYSWGNYPQTKQTIVYHNWRCDNIKQKPNTLLPYGLGRSYGDSCLNSHGYLLSTERLNHFISFDTQKGLLTCESGVTLNQILQFIVPKGWFLPVTPGTSYVTVGGAIANDVHGKNHHIAGSFGQYITQFELLRSNGDRIHCSKEKNKEWYYATIAGLGLTGLITWAELQLKPIKSNYINMEQIPFGNLEDFYTLTQDSNHYEYIVSWLDTVSSGRKLGRGVLFRGNHADSSHDFEDKKSFNLKQSLSIPFISPINCANSLNVGMFNNLYYHIHRLKPTISRTSLFKFFYPLDGIAHWNRLYGPKGFFQYQCVVPLENRTAVSDIVKLTSQSKLASFLSVLKILGDKPSNGILSFARPGATLALDFPNKGEETLKLLKKFDTIVKEAKGAVYPAKDARMSSDAFQTFYPNWTAMNSYIDPHFSSDFWKRVTR